MIKNLKFNLCLVLLAIAFSSCSKEESVAPELTVSKEELSFGKNAYTQELEISTNVSWSVLISEEWCTVSPTSGVAGNSSIEVSVTENTTVNPREATLTVTAEGLVQQVKIKQISVPLIIIGDKEQNIPAAGKTISFTIESSGEYAVEVSGSWITASQTSGAKRDFVIATSPSLAPREGTITFSLGTVKEIITIKQVGTVFDIPNDKTGVESNAVTLAAKMIVGWNLGNSLEAIDSNNQTADETMWGNPVVTKTLIDGVKAAGFNAIRIPCAWDYYMEDQETHTIKASRLARIKEVVDYIVENDMYAIINIHWDGGWLENNPFYETQEAINRKQRALWEQIATYFRNYDEHLLFAGTNEVHANYNRPTPEYIDVQLSFNQTFVDAVRSTGGKNAWRNLVVQAYNTNIDFAIEFLEMPVDIVSDRLMAEIHYYDPYDFTLNNTSVEFLWGKEFANRSPNVSNWAQEDFADEQFGKMKTNFVDKGVPVILGEYCATYRATLTGQDLIDHVKSRNNYMYYITKSSRSRGLIPFYWDNGPTGNNASGLFNRTTGEQVHSDIIQSIINGATGK